MREGEKGRDCRRDVANRGPTSSRIYEKQGGAVLDDILVSSVNDSNCVRVDLSARQDGHESDLHRRDTMWTWFVDFLVAAVAAFTGVWAYNAFF
jgi:hypothetical protein